MEKTIWAEKANKVSTRQMWKAKIQRIRRPLTSFLLEDTFSLDAPNYHVNIQLDE